MRIIALTLDPQAPKPSKATPETRPVDPRPNPKLYKPETLNPKPENLSLSGSPECQVLSDVAETENLGESMFTRLVTQGVRPGSQLA